MVATKLMTAKDLELLDHQVHCELIEGELIPMSPTASRHMVVGGDMSFAISAYLSEHQLGRLVSAEAGFQLARQPDSVVAPDYAFLTTAQFAEARAQTGYSELIPSLVIEIKSPTDRESEIARKLRIYQQAGVAEVWWLRPEERTLTVHRPAREPEIVRAPAIFTTSEVLPGLSIDLAALYD